MTSEIPLTNGGVTLVDDDDYHWLRHYRWVCTHDGYAVRFERRAGQTLSFRMAREIMKTPRGMTVDHISGDKLDNRRCNLRNCTQAENTRNSRKRIGGRSEFKGVSRTPRKSGPWVALINLDKTIVKLGNFENEIDAAHAYDAAARHHFGEFACTNFPVGPERSARGNATTANSGTVDGRLDPIEG